MEKKEQNLTKENRQQESKQIQALVTENSLIQCSLNEIGEIELVQVMSGKDIHYAIWKRLIETYHYLGHGKLYGLQMRYLIKSERLGWIGAMSFSSGAWRLQARDRWIGWNENNRLKHTSVRTFCFKNIIIDSISIR